LWRVWWCFKGGDALNQARDDHTRLGMRLPLGL
jgi:hypothetical protein